MAASEPDQRQIASLRQRLLEMQQEVAAQLNDIATISRPVELDQQSVGRVSRIDAIQQQQMALANQRQATRLLKQVELALARIDNGEYGNCLQCEEPIAIARLQAQPFAGFCLDCQSAREKA
jgi:DnaK suppressor protein